MKRLGPLNLFLFDEYWINTILILWIYSLYIISVNLMTIVFNQEIFIFNFFLSEIFTMMMRYTCTSKLLNHIKIILQFVIMLKYYSIYGLIFFTALCCWKRCLGKTSKRDWEKRQRNRISSNIHEEIRGYFDIIRIFFIVRVIFFNLHKTFTIKSSVSINTFWFGFTKFWIVFSHLGGVQASKEKEQAALCDLGSGRK